MSRLWDRIVAVTDQAVRDGVLVTLPTDGLIVDDRGIPFVVHVSALRQRKALATASQRERRVDPFLPPDPKLLVAELPDGYVAVLNKFNVLPHHLLIVTRDFQPQDPLLGRTDMAALLSCMSEVDGLGFYNGGTVAGASQPHKHLQLAPLPLGPGPRPTPLDAVVPEGLETGRIAKVPAYPFDHALVALGGAPLAEHGADRLHETYLRACGEVGLTDGARPCNLLLTRSWMLVVPRSREHWNAVSINALGFAGSLLVRSRDELERLRRVGPVAALGSVVDEDEVAIGSQIPGGQREPARAGGSRRPPTTKIRYSERGDT